MSSWRGVRERERELVILTRESRARWDIVISILRHFVERLRSGEESPVLFTRRLLSKHDRYVYSVIDKLNKHGITKPLDHEFPHDAVRLIPTGLTIISRDLEIWEEISHVKPLSELQTYALKVIRQLLQEFDTFLKWSTGV